MDAVVRCPVSREKAEQPRSNKACSFNNALATAVSRTATKPVASMPPFGWSSHRARQVPFDAGQEAMQAAPNTKRRRGSRNPALRAASRASGAGLEVALSEDGTNKRTVEEIYQRRTQHEHVLLRPDSYVGSTDKQRQEHWILDEEGVSMQRRVLEYVPSLYKIFDEILVNAADHLIREPSMNALKVDINTANGTVSVWNNGKGLPIQMHRDHGCYVPELVFGHLLTSDNYNDNEKKVVGGRNGYGAKLANIFSTRFIVETSDSSAGLAYRQVWTDNMFSCNRPEIWHIHGEDYTRVTFHPDLGRFGMSSFEGDIVALMRRRAFDVAASTHGRCQVYLDGVPLSVHSLSDYADLFVAPGGFRIYGRINERWEVAIGLTDGTGFQHVSFVNSICTSRGGTHVNYISDQVVDALMEKIDKGKDRGSPLAVKAQHVRSHLCIFVNCLIENPAFDSQCKETLTSKRSHFGSMCELPESMLQAVLESGIVESLQEWSRALGRSELAQHLNRGDYSMTSRLFGIPKLEDADKAGTKEAQNCTLILTEGDSAKALAVAGLSVVGREHYGVFPLRGKLRNVRDLTVKQLLENKELDSLMKIVALDSSKSYSSTKGLRYGSIMVMADQDPDGSHIKGLLINFIQYWFPSLLRVEGFLKEFVTPIVKVSKGEEKLTFFTLNEYELWKKQNHGGGGWKCKYYKGLGTSTSAEAQEYFSDLGSHEISFTYSGADDDDLIDMAFNGKRADDRKKWIACSSPDVFVDHSQPTLTYADFVNKELVAFARYDVDRMIPCLVDGLKIGQRKVIFCCFRRKLTCDMKVAQLSGYVAEHAAYHHGEASLHGTIISLAQTFVGANNINLLVPSGQFGTRMQGGRDHAAARYIFTRLSRVTRCIFPEEDDAVLDYLKDEGQDIEPKWYAPVIPMVLVNGANGIGVGWSTSVPNYNPREIIANLRRHLRNEPLMPMTPWYKGFKGSIMPGKEDGKFDVNGVATKRGRTKVEIVELPLRKWTQDYKEWILEQLPQAGAERRATITDVREYHTENLVRFVCSITPDKLAEAERRGLDLVFHLRGSLATTNMMLFDAEGKIRKYDSPEQILVEFADARLGVYAKRRQHMIRKLERELTVLRNKMLFIQFVVNEEIPVGNCKIDQLVNHVRDFGLLTMYEIQRITTGEQMDDDAVPLDSGPQGYGYLLQMKLWTLTEERLGALETLVEEKSAALDQLRRLPLEAMWERDLARLEEALDAVDASDAKEEESALRLMRKSAGKEDDEGLVNWQCVLVFGSKFHAKRVRTSEWRARRVGTKMDTKNVLDKKSRVTEGDDNEAAEEVQGDDALSGVYCCHEFDKLLLFTQHGMVYTLQALDVPLKKRDAVGTPISNLVPGFSGGEHQVTSVITVPQGLLKDQVEECVVLVSKYGVFKKVPLSRFRALQPGRCIKVMDVQGSDELLWAHRTSETDALLVASKQGKILRTSLGKDCRCSTIKSAGSIVMRTRDGDQVASCGVSRMADEELRAIDQMLRKKREEAAQARFRSEDGRHKHFQSVKAVVGQDALDQGQDPDAAVLQYERVTSIPTPAKRSWSTVEDRHTAEAGVAHMPQATSAVSARNLVASRASQFLPGKYRAIQSRVGVSSDIRRGGEILRELKRGEVLEIVDIQHAEEDNRIRGHLAEGGWISVQNTETGYTWVQQEADCTAPHPEPARIEEDDDDYRSAQDDDDRIEAGSDEGGDSEIGEDLGTCAEDEGQQRGTQADRDVGDCVFLTTRLGYGHRVPLTEFSLRRRGGVGLKGCCFVAGGDCLLALRIVSGRMVKVPAKARQAWKLWFSEREGETDQFRPRSCGLPPEGSPGAAIACGASPPRSLAGLSCRGEPERRWSFRELFRRKQEFAALPEAEQQPYLMRAEEERKRYEREMELYRDVAFEEILVGTAGGKVSRLPVCSTTVKPRGRRVKPIVKLPPGDELRFVSLLSSKEADPDFASDGQPASARRRLLEPKRGDEQTETLLPVGPEADV